MTKELLNEIENDYWNEKADPIDMAEVFDLANKALEQQQDKVIHNHPCEDCYYNDGDVHAECVICDKAESEDKE